MVLPGSISSDPTMLFDRSRNVRFCGFGCLSMAIELAATRTPADGTEAVAARSVRQRVPGVRPTRSLTRSTGGLAGRRRLALGLGWCGGWGIRPRAPTVEG